MNIKVFYLTKDVCRLSFPLAFYLSLSRPSCSAARYLIKQKCHKNNLKNPSACQILTLAQLRCHHKFWSLWFFYRQYGKRWAKWMREMVASNVRKREKKGERRGKTQMQSVREMCVCVHECIGGMKRDENSLKDGLRAHLLTACILMQHCGNPASKAAAKVTRDYQDHD